MATRLISPAEFGFPEGPENLQLLGPTLCAQIGFDANWSGGDGSLPELHTNQYPALVDTGAQKTAIDDDLAKELNLPVRGMMETSGAHGRTLATMYVAQIYVPSVNRIFPGVFSGAQLASGGQPHYVLLGRDFLLGFNLVYDGSDGRVSLEQRPTALDLTIPVNA